MDVEKLIVLVRQRPTLYDERSAGYHDPANRRHAWDEVSRLMHEPVDECRYRWRSLRSMYNRYLQNKDSQKNPNWQHAQQLAFLKPYLRRYRDQVSEPEPMPLPETESQDDEDDDDQEEEEEEEVEKFTASLRKPTPTRLSVVRPLLAPRPPSNITDTIAHLRKEYEPSFDEAESDPDELRVMALLIALTAIIIGVVVAWNLYCA